MSWVHLQCVIVACPGHTQIIFCNLYGSFPLILQLAGCFLPIVHNIIHAIYFMIQIWYLISINNLK